MSEPTYIITGASGLLGRNVYNQFKKAFPKANVMGLAHSRAKGELVKLNLVDSDAVETFMSTYKPKVVIHCAAERFPDAAERDPEGTLKLNAQATKYLAELCQLYGARLVYISTNFVFDGFNPPFQVDSKPNPLQFYGNTKLLGEKEVLKAHSNGVIIRVPVLYGEVDYYGESAVNVLVQRVKESDKHMFIDHHGARFPTYIGDVSRFCVAIAEFETSHKLPQIAHFSSPEITTDYGICEVLSKILEVSIGHLTPDLEVPPYVEGVPYEPEDARMTVDQLDKFNVPDFEFTKLKDFFAQYLNSN